MQTLFFDFDMSLSLCYKVVDEFLTDCMSDIYQKFNNIYLPTYLPTSCLMPRIHMGQ